MKIIWRLIVPGSFWERTCNTLVLTLVEQMWSKQFQFPQIWRWKYIEPFQQRRRNIQWGSWPCRHGSCRGWSHTPWSPPYHRPQWPAQSCQRPLSHPSKLFGQKPASKLNNCTSIYVESPKLFLWVERSQNCCWLRITWKFKVCNFPRTLFSNTVNVNFKTKI